MTTRHDLEARIAALREALERILSQHGDSGWAEFEDAKDVLAADDAAASAPLPDLSLAEGSRWSERHGSPSVIDWTGTTTQLEQHETGVLVACDEGGPYLSDVLALARRKGVV